jgi:hypothetical protein
MTFHYDGFNIESFEAGSVLWHARIRRSDFKPLLIDGALFTKVEVGFAWPDQEPSPTPRSISIAAKIAGPSPNKSRAKSSRSYENGVRRAES